MSKLIKLDFGAKKEERNKEGVAVRVWESPKYKESKEKAEELIGSAKYGLTEADFWILKTFSAKCCTYAGLIISHNGCLKINDALPKEQKFIPSKVAWVRDAQGDLVMSYICDEQGIYEFGEASFKNCQNSYPFAMVLKRLMDRVILKNSKIAFSGIMSEVESDEFKNNNSVEGMITDAQISELIALGADMKKLADLHKVEDVSKLTYEQANKAIEIKKGKK